MIHQSAPECWIAPNGMDPECTELCKAINDLLPGLQTVESCCGHGKLPFRIWFTVSTIKALREELPILLYWCDSCHIGFDWPCFVETDCGMSPPMFRLESYMVGDQAYLEAGKIAKHLREDAV